ncbi:AAA domain-containing protein [Candidatus Bathyarchaeota archaeon]|nr:AAA domain-containing protein [Candidatus Bathyarchaeota archaeon]
MPLYFSNLREPCSNIQSCRDYMLIEGSSDSPLRNKVWTIINITQANQLFIHSNQLEVQYTIPDRKRVQKKIVPEILTISVLNALVPNSAMLLIGGHGGAKTTLVKLLGRMFTGKSLDDIEQAILRGHPQLTEEKILATLDLPKLMKGEEKVKWRHFVKDFWKIIDELNRMTPYAQNILLSMLAEHRVKFYDSSFPVPQYCLFATMNPQDSGTFMLPMPFLDRFGISLPFSMPTTNDLSLILKSKDTKLFGYDEILQVPKVLSIDELISIWRAVDAQEVEDEAEQFIHAIVREFSLCARINKGVSNDKKVGPDLCSKCHFDTTKSICNKVTTILSVRAAKDLYRYSKALAWLMNLEVDMHVVNTVAPYVIQHRVDYVSSELNKGPYYGDKLHFTRSLLKQVKNRFFQRKEMIEVMEGIKRGGGSPDQLDEIKLYGKNDLIVKLDFVPVAKMYLDENYRQYLSRIEQSYDAKDVDDLVAIKEELLNDSEMMNKGELLTKVSVFLNKLTLRNYAFPFSKWRDEIWAELSTEFRYLETELRKSLTERTQKQLRTADSVIGLIVTGTDDDSIVSIDVSGGKDALKIKDILLRAGVYHDDEL